MLKMKNLNFLFLALAITILAGCNNKKTKEDSNKAIIGIWQNTNNSIAEIEFTEEGTYYLRMNGERILDNDSTIIKYNYDPLSEENNLIIYGNPKAGDVQATLVIISPERINISMIHEGKVISYAEFTKAKEPLKL